MPDDLGPTVEEIEREIYLIRKDIETMWEAHALRKRQAGNPTEWLQLKEFQKACPNLPPIQRG